MIPVRRGYGKRLADAEAEELTRGDRCVESFGLVHREPNSLRVPPRQVGDVLVRGGHSLARVYQDHRRICLFERADRLLDHAFVDADLSARHTTGIDDQVGHGSELAETVFAVARKTGVIRDQRVAGTSQAVK